MRFWICVAVLAVIAAAVVLLILGLIVRAILARRPKQIPPERQAIAITPKSRKV